MIINGILLPEVPYSRGTFMLKQLLKNGVLSIAKEPEDNPENFADSPYIATLIAHDYPGKTPTMWNAAYREYGIPMQAVMLVGDPVDAKTICDALRSDPLYLGGGAGVGFKDEIVPFLDEMDPVARAIGSVNFIMKTTEGNLRGYNTDGEGYALSLEKVLKEKGRRIRSSLIVMLGAGGTGRSIAFALVGRGARVMILNRTIDKAKELANHVNEYFHVNLATFGNEGLISEMVPIADVVINVSTKGAVGTLESYSPLAQAVLPATEVNIENNRRQANAVLQSMKGDTIVSDIILRKDKTPLLLSAENAGFTTLDGVPMVVRQGALAFWILHHDVLEERGILRENVQEVMKNAAGL